MGGIATPQVATADQLMLPGFVTLLLLIAKHRTNPKCGDKGTSDEVALMVPQPASAAGYLTLTSFAWSKPLKLLVRCRRLSCPLALSPQCSRPPREARRGGAAAAARSEAPLRPSAHAHAARAKHALTHAHATCTTCTCPCTCPCTCTCTHAIHMHMHMPYTRTCTCTCQHVHIVTCYVMFMFM